MPPGMPPPLPALSPSGGEGKDVLPLPAPSLAARERAGLAPPTREPAAPPPAGRLGLPHRRLRALRRAGGRERAGPGGGARGAGGLRRGGALGGRHLRPPLRHGRARRARDASPAWTCAATPPPRATWPTGPAVPRGRPCSGPPRPPSAPGWPPWPRGRAAPGRPVTSPPSTARCSVPPAPPATACSSSSSSRRCAASSPPPCDSAWPARWRPRPSRRRLAPEAEAVLGACAGLGLDDVAQPSPLLDLAAVSPGPPLLEALPELTHDRAPTANLPRPSPPSLDRQHQRSPPARRPRAR